MAGWEGAGRPPQRSGREGLVCGGGQREGHAKSGFELGGRDGLAVLGLVGCGNLARFVQQRSRHRRRSTRGLYRFRQSQDRSRGGSRLGRRGRSRIGLIRGRSRSRFRRRVRADEGPDKLGTLWKWRRS